MPAAFAFLPAGVGGAFAPLLVLWGLLSFGHAILFHLVHAGGFLIGGNCNPLVCLGFVLLIVAFKLMAHGALYRSATFGKDARKEGLGPLGLQFGAPELRLLATSILVGLFYLVIAGAIFIVFAVIFNLSGLAGDERNTLKALQTVFCRHQGADWIFIAYAVAAHVFLFFLVVRFSLAHVATVAQKKIVALNALGLSSGNVFKLFCGLVLFSAPLVLVMIAVVHHLMPSLPHGAPRLMAHAGLLAFTIFIIFPLIAGFLSSAYRQIVDLRAK
ncbi:hypothetical protein [Asticcacaulis solisilvae]|uniref:hypothetical protein n=1 Tax=Asticcacaulis solisilvae TaxID=1217274 RepID=UPI003FD870C8